MMSRWLRLRIAWRRLQSISPLGTSKDRCDCDKIIAFGEEKNSKPDVFTPEKRALPFLASLKPNSRLKLVLRSKMSPRQVRALCGLAHIATDQLQRDHRMSLRGLVQSASGRSTDRNGEGISRLIQVLGVVRGAISQVVRLSSHSL